MMHSTSASALRPGHGPLLDPRAVAIIGMSRRPATPGRFILDNLTLNAFAGDIHLIGREAAEIDGRPVGTRIADLPEGIDLAVLALPAAGVEEALRDCAARGVRAAVIHASGFAETGNAAGQERLSQIARDAGMVLLGPNCLGFMNHVNRLRISFVNAQALPEFDASGPPAVGIASQSGGLLAHIRMGFSGRGLQLSRSFSLGNEAGLDLAGAVAAMAADDVTALIVAYAEEIRDVAAFLDAVALARSRGKPVVLLHPGRSARAAAATASHTGAMAGDHAVMSVALERAGVVLVGDLDEMIDVAEILAHHPEGAAQGPGIITVSGAYCAIAHDFCDAIGLPLPALAAHSLQALGQALPDYLAPGNPLDLAALPSTRPDLLESCARALLDDPNLGSLVLSLPVSSGARGAAFVEAVTRARAASDKPVILTVLGDRTPVPGTFDADARTAGLMTGRSIDRSLRALRLIRDWTQASARPRRVDPAPAATATATATAPAALIGPDGVVPGAGPMAEWRAKAILRAQGLAVPDGGLAQNLAEAQAIAARLGGRVAMKAQAAQLAHKTELGGVILNVDGPDAVAEAFATLQGRTRGLDIDGVLVERMAPPGVELVIGARRDPRWGPVVLAGLGGILVEALGDVRLMPADLEPADIRAEVLRLRAAALLGPFRGREAVDLDAVADLVARLGALMIAHPEISEVDLNPVFAHPAGCGCTIADALIILDKAP